jgi:F0F1-type ATP synthase assembly protein I
MHSYKKAKKEAIMANNQQKKKPYGTLFIMGILSIALYAALLTHQDIITRYFALGGAYAFLPILTAFLFSFIHGNFTGSFWTVLGVEAAKKKKEVK